MEEEEAWHGVGYNMPLIPASYHARGGAHIPANNGALMNGPHLHSVEMRGGGESERERDLKSEGQNEVIYLLMRPFLMRARTKALTQAHHMPLCQAAKGALQFK